MMIDLESWRGQSKGTLSEMGWNDQVLRKIFLIPTQDNLL